MRDAVREVSGLEGWRDALEELVDWSLVERRELDGWSRYEMLPTVEEYAGLRLRDKETVKKLGLDEMALRRRHAEHYLGVAQTMDDLLRPDTRRPKAEELAEREGISVGEAGDWLTKIALATFDLERANMLSAVDWAYAGEEWELARRLVEQLNTYFDIRALWADQVRCGELAVEAAKREGNRQAEGGALNNLGVVYEAQGRWDEAIECYEQDLAICRELGDRHGEGKTLNNLGSVYLQQGCWDEAIECFEESLRIKRYLGDRHGEGKTLTGLGNVYAQQGRWDEAIECYEQDLAICRELGDRHGEGKTLTNLGLVYEAQGRWEEAIECYEKALGIFRGLGDRHGEGTTLNNLGLVYADQGRWDEAIGCYEESLRICRDLGDRHGEGKTLGNLGTVYAQQGELDKALAAAGQALRIFQELKAHADLVTCHSQIASLSLRAEDSSACFDHLAQALSLALQLQPKLVTDAIGSIISIAKELAGQGRFAETAALGGLLYGMVVEMEKEIWRSEELKVFGVLSRRVCAVIALVGKSLLEEAPEEEREEARKTALEIAKEVDEATDGRWALEEWVEGISG
jgi:tetratricopeptide (TPR) repeat protein